MNFAHEPADRGYIVEALMVRSNDQGRVGREFLQPAYFVSCSQNIGVENQEKTQDIHALFMCFVTEQVKAYPLYHMEEHQCNPK